MSHVNTMFSGIYDSASEESNDDQPLRTSLPLSRSTEPPKPPKPAGNPNDGKLIARVSECFGVSQKRVLCRIFDYYFACVDPTLVI